MDCIKPNIIYPNRTVDWIDQNEEYPVSVPCGKCLPCLVNKRTDWMFRLEAEHRSSKGAIFVTLTYDRNHLPSNGSLDKKHLQLYLKKLRKQDQKENGETKIRYFAVGEYGSNYGRPHYHLLLFNVSEKLARACWRNKKGDPIGIVHVGTVTAASVGYVTKYIVQTDKDNLLWKSIQRPFCVMSRAYGIGAKYLTDEMVNWHKSDDKNFAIRDGQKVRLPRFYRSKIWYHANDKERVSKKSMLQAAEQKMKEFEWYKKRYGSDAEFQMRSNRDHLIERIKTKIAYTQTL